jgi:hypothetical protein
MLHKKLHAEQPVAVHYEICEWPDAVDFSRPLNLELNQDDLEILYRLSGILERLRDQISEGQAFLCCAAT